MGRREIQVRGDTCRPAASAPPTIFRVARGAGADNQAGPRQLRPIRPGFMVDRTEGPDYQGPRVTCPVGRKGRLAQRAAFREVRAPLAGGLAGAIGARGLVGGGVYFRDVMTPRGQFRLRHGGWNAEAVTLCYGDLRVICCKSCGHFAIWVELGLRYRSE